MIKIKKTNGLLCPIINCDKCKEIINEKRSANVLLDWCEDNKETEIKIVHKKCDDRELPLNISLEKFLKQLTYNSEHKLK